MTDDTAERTSPMPALRSRASKLVRVEVIEGADAGQSADALLGRSLTVGTAPDVELRLTDRMVSRYHLDVSIDAAGVRLLDLGSTNGTHIGGLRVVDARLAGGATVCTLGQSSIRISELSGRAPDLDDAPSRDPLPGLIAVSPAMKDVARMIGKLGPTSVSVMLHGETGTGKEVVARALHERSTRAARPFVVVDCGAVPPTLIASELFGHEKGAFTSADRRHVGAFERADGGTLFLDEVGELPISVQPVLLGALERRRFRRVGGTQDLEVDVRVIAATHRDLRSEANAGGFRADLLYRLAVARIVIPPLRDRPEDIEALIDHFAAETAGLSGRAMFSPAQIAEMLRHRWAGNARELRNAVEAAAALGTLQLDASDSTPARADSALPDAHDSPGTYREARANALKSFETVYLSRLMGFTAGNASYAARVAQMDRPYLLSLLKRHGLR